MPSSKKKITFSQDPLPPIGETRSSSQTKPATGFAAFMNNGAPATDVKTAIAAKRDSVFELPAKRGAPKKVAEKRSSSTVVTEGTNNVQNPQLETD